LLREYLRGFRRTSDIMKKFVAAYSNGNTQAQDENVAEAYEN
jgi:hypothetical protein